MNDQLRVLRLAVRSLSFRVCFARWHERHPGRLELYASVRGSRGAMQREAEAALVGAGLVESCVVRRVPARRLERLRSVSELAELFGRGTSVYDPTGCIVRARSLLACGAQLRGALGASLAALHFEPASRTLYAGLRPTVGADAAGWRASNLARAAETLKAWHADGAAFDLRLRLLTGAAPAAAIPLAGRGAEGKPWQDRVTARPRALSLAIGALFGLGVSASATAAPAVSQPNAAFAAEGGKVGADGTGLADPSVTVPVGPVLGAQLEGAGGTSGGAQASGLGGQLFWREPSLGLVGLAAAHENRGGVHRGAYGAEGELYLGPITITSLAGYQDGSGRGGFGVLDVAWYVTDNLELVAGGSGESRRGLGHAGVEYQPSLGLLSGLSFFADGEIGGGSGQILAGLKYYFSAPKSLLRRHREDTAPLLLGRFIQRQDPGALGATGATGATGPTGPTGPTGATGPV